MKTPIFMLIKYNLNILEIFKLYLINMKIGDIPNISFEDIGFSLFGPARDNNYWLCDCLQPMPN